MADRNVRLFVAVAIGKGAGMLSGILAIVLAGRLLGPGGLGRFTLLMAAGTLLHTALINWTHASTVRYGHEEWVLTGGLNRTLGARLPILAISLGLALVIVVWQPAHWAARWFSAQPSDWWMIALFAFSVWLTGEGQATLQASDRIMWQAVLAPLIGIGSLLLLALLFLFGGQSLGHVVIAVTALPVLGWGGRVALQPRPVAHETGTAAIR